MHCFTLPNHCGCALPEKQLRLASACQLSRFLVRQLDLVLSVCGNFLYTFQVILSTPQDFRVEAPSYFAEARQSGPSPRTITFFRDHGNQSH